MKKRTFLIITQDKWSGKVLGDDILDALDQALSDYPLLLVGQIVSIKEV
jgi:hypothetical protein